MGGGTHVTIVKAMRVNKLFEGPQLDPAEIAPLWRAVQKSV